MSQFLSVSYPFVPKSTARMELGQFWSIPLPGSWFACGRVLQFNEKNGKRDSRIFLAGLLDWIDAVPPTSEAISGAQLVTHGAAHVKTISENEGQILGLRELTLDGITIPETLDGTSGPMLQQGFQVIGPAANEQREALPVFSTWGFRVIVLHAERLLKERLAAMDKTSS